MCAMLRYLPLCGLSIAGFPRTAADEPPATLTVADIIALLARYERPAGFAPMILGGAAASPGAYHLAGSRAMNRPMSYRVDPCSLLVGQIGRAFRPWLFLELRE